MKTLRYCIKNWWDNSKTNVITNILAKYYNIIYDDKNPQLIIYSSYNGFNKNTSIIKEIPSLFIMGENRLIPKIPTGIHYSMTFEQTKDNNLQAGYPLFFNCGRINKDINKDKDKLLNERKLNDFSNKKFACAVISNNMSRGVEFRNNLVNIITKYKDIDYGGAWRNNVGGPVLDKLKFLNNYKFNICCENSQRDMYITEKILDAYLGNTIPIYAGGKAETIFNPDSFINLNNKSEEEIIETIKEVNENDELYKKMYNAQILLDENYFKKKYEEIEQFLVNLVEKIL